ncbi:MAG: hypothetical protein DLM57_08325 [Pseudonocardiales bacterium]|nr:MAG: hypothetical protein DLM57_08325 [Pseudonocardiales bacterium]
MTAPARPAPSIGAPGIALVVVGAVLVLIAFTALDWYPGSAGPSAVAHITFSDLHRLTADASGVGIAAAYFGWLAWVLLILVIVVGFAANLPTRATNALRVAGFVLGLAGAAATYLALAKLASAGGGSRGAFDHAKAGVWLAVVGYLVAAAGAVIGPVRRT